MSREDQFADAFFEQYPRWSRGGYPGEPHLLDKTLIALFKKTWRRLPKHDRALLRELIFQVREATSRDETPLGSTSIVDDGEPLEGGMGYVADMNYEIVLYPDRYREFSDAAVIGIIAHELAHAAPRHMRMAPSLALMIHYSREEYEKIKQVHEWEADHRAWVWGFSEEIEETWKALGHSEPPWLWEYEGGAPWIQLGGTAMTYQKLVARLGEPLTHEHMADTEAVTIDNWPCGCLRFVGTRADEPDIKFTPCKEHKAEFEAGTVL